MTSPSFLFGGVGGGEQKVMTHNFKNVAIWGSSVTSVEEFLLIKSVLEFVFVLNRLSLTFKWQWVIKMCLNLTFKVNF